MDIFKTSHSAPSEYGGVVNDPEYTLLSPSDPGLSLARCTFCQGFAAGETPEPLFLSTCTKWTLKRYRFPPRVCLLGASECSCSDFYSWQLRAVKCELAPADYVSLTSTGANSHLTALNCHEYKSLTLQLHPTPQLTHPRGEIIPVQGLASPTRCC
ncbi:hypothetical protein H257_16459 [Aphanomyces astaci]|uniref:Uncharacterized protein n=1 Tax=Aphanomyces astaci TaxID=112090 RepID=W4FKK9_APHAT|nr:hypothetical protein H257_16459 [Aphanomyces astaci]ETV67374.1 hypothetical protein H257_16459 [Aphanomyces astaci]|eukprot:XP_009843189.1 hypothetical protein H257_16459 [Aphanomyces astaci]